MATYKEAPLATRPKTLDPGEYFNLSPDYRRAEEKRAALRAQLKRQYLQQLNNPHRKELIVRRTKYHDLQTLAWGKTVAMTVTIFHIVLVYNFMMF